MCRCLSRTELEFVANTLVFVLSGVIIAARIYNSEHTTESLIQPRDYGYGFLLWVYLSVRLQASPGSNTQVGLHSLSSCFPPFETRFTLASLM